MEKIRLEGDAGEALELFVLESTRLMGNNYILAADTEQGDGDCYILKECSAGSEDEAVYELVEDETLLDTLLSVFAELLDDVDLEG